MRCRIVNSKAIVAENRFDGSYHNAESIVYDNVIKAHSSHTLGYYCSSIFTSGRNKRTYTTKEYGNPFLSNSDASSQNPFSNCKYSSKKYGFDESSCLKNGMILTGRVGAIGQTMYVPKFWEDYCALGSDNMIRIVVKPEFKNGAIYAYLASRVGCLSFWKHATGGVQPFITDSMVASLPIPEFNDELMKTVDALIKESARLRQLSFESLCMAHDILEQHFPAIPDKCKFTKIKANEIYKSQLHRFEANYHIADGKYYSEYIKSCFKWISLGDATQKIWRPDIFKRMYVSNGIPFLSSSDIMQCVPSSTKQVSKRTPNKEAFIIGEKWILVPRSGTIGEVVYTTSQHAQKLVSEDVIRIIPNDILSSGYIFAFLSSSVGKALIQRPIFGSVIQHVEPPLLEKIPIPIIEDEKMAEIGKLAETYRECWGKSAEKELEAISLIEAEIEKWNKQ